MSIRVNSRDQFQISSGVLLNVIGNMTHFWFTFITNKKETGKEPGNGISVLYYEIFIFSLYMDFM